jgi:hypothetical protein
VIDIAGGEPGMIQAVADRTLGELMRVVEVRFLPVFDAIEPFLLDRRDEFAVDEQGRGRLVIHRVDSKNVHQPTSNPAIPLRFERRQARPPLDPVAEYRTCGDQSGDNEAILSTP